MPFTARDLRYKPDETYSALYAHLSRHAQRFLQSLKFDALELDIVVDHVVEQLIRMGLLGGGDRTPLTALDHLSNAQFYAFLNRSIRNKAIDRLRKKRLPISSLSSMEVAEEAEGENDLLNDVVEPAWGPNPFATPEEIVLALSSQQELRQLLKHCIKELGAAPRQLQAVLGELNEFDATALLQDVLTELQKQHLSTDLNTPVQHASQHKDHAHKKLRHCLQESSTNLVVMVALRLTEYGVHVTSSNEFIVDIQTLAQDDLSESDVQIGLNQLVAEGILDQKNIDVDAIHITSTQIKRLARFYKDE